MLEADKKFRPWRVCPADYQPLRDAAVKEGDALLASGRLKEVALIAEQVDKGLMGCTSAATDILTHLRANNLSSKMTLQAQHVAPRALNRPLETDRLRTLVVNIMRQGFDWKACEGAACVQDAPGAREVEHASACACPPDPSFRTLIRPGRAQAAQCVGGAACP